MASRPAVEPALVTRAQRALCTILVAATLAACSPPVAPRPAARPLAAPPVQRQYTPLVPNLALGSPIDGSSMRFFVPTCLFQNDPNCLQAIFAIGEITPKTPGHFAVFTHALSDAQSYSFEADPNGATYVARLTTRGWRQNGHPVVPGRDEYYDYSF